jgi:hypothetical protein
MYEAILVVPLFAALKIVNKDHGKRDIGFKIRHTYQKSLKETVK